jgi:ubiquinol-cytochrome c reductase cytochrome b subunit
MARLLALLESRTGLLSAWRATMSDKRPPAGIGWLRTLGFAALTLAVVQLLSGLALALHYVPSADLAYDSIRAFEQDVPGGALVRSLHHFGASMFVVVAAAHLARVYFTGAYKAPRELTWLTGLGLFGIVLAFGFTGYLLPWDQKAFFATKVGTEIAGKAPLIGDLLRVTLNGGDEVGPPTLTRFYVVHVVLLPLALVALLAAHLALIQRHGVAAPGRPVGDEGEPGAPYFPHHVLREAIVGLLVAALLFGLAAAFRAPLEALAEPAETGYEPRPDWYFAGMFQLLKLFEGPLESVGSIWLPTLLALALAALPFVDRGPQRSWRRRPLATAIGAAIALAIAGLTAVGIADAPANPATLRHPLDCDAIEKRGYLALRRLG